MKSEKIYTEYLLIKAQGGDQAAADDLISLLRLKVKAFALKLLGDSYAVDDCVQDALLKIFQRMSEVKQVKAVHTWIYRVVHTTCMDYVRKNPTTSDSTVEPTADLNHLDQQLDVKSAIATLSEEQQVIIFLFYYEGFKVAEMADILIKPAGTIKSLLFDARDHIKSKLSKD